MVNDLVKEFRDAIKNRILDSNLSHMYKLLFDLYSDTELKELLEKYRSEYNEDKDNWFYYFHKSIRQTDFFKGFRILKHVNLLTPEQTEQRNEILRKRAKERKEFYLNNSNNEYSTLDVKPERIASLNELKKLNTLLNNEDEIHRGGIFDSFLWCLISMDGENQLKSVMELTFKICND